MVVLLTSTVSAGYDRRLGRFGWVGGQCFPSAQGLLLPGRPRSGGLRGAGG